MTPTLTDDAEAYTPTGDPEHVAYGANYVWSCSCGRGSVFITTRPKAIGRATEHEANCGGTTEVDVL
jgi:hypothetical protein